MLTRFVFSFAVVLVGLSLTSAQPTSDQTQALRRISASIIQGESRELLRQLTDDIGPRLVGTPAYDRAAQWAAEKFRAAGLSNVRLEEFTLPNGWQRGSARARIVSPIARSLHVESVGWGPSTPSGGVRGDLILVSDVSPESLRSRAAELKHRIVIIDVEKAVPPDHPLGFAHLRASYALFSTLGVRAVLLPNDIPNNVPGFLDTGNARGTILPLPVGEIGWEDYLLLKRHLARGRVIVDLEWHNKVSGPKRVSNVIAEIPGGTLPREWVILGAHLDSWDLGTGAQDNGTGVVMVLEAARAIASLGQSPRRTIRFALWAAEEPGPPGSAMFIKRHAAELRDCVAALNTDFGGGTPRGWHVLGREDVREAMRPIGEQLRNLGADSLSMYLNCGSDECPFVLEGIPALKLWVDMDRYEEIHHKPSDTFDKVDSTSLKAGGAVVAVTVYAIADLPGRIAPQIGQKSIREILRAAKLDFDLMEALWKP